MEQNLLKDFNLRESTRRIKVYARWTIASMIACGVELMWVKQNLDHGQWLKWLKNDLAWSPTTTSRFMNVARLYLEEQGIKQIQKATVARCRQTLASNFALTQNLATRSNIDPWGNQPRQLTTGANWLKVFDVWNFASRDPSLGAEWPGNIPGQIVENVLYYYTKKGDLVVDPMAGGGSTVDACKKHNRRCLAYDIKPLQQKGIKYNDITKGFPNECKNCDLIFLDPPYFKTNRQFYGQASLSALEIDEFRKAIDKLARDCFNTVRDGGFVTFLMQNYYINFAKLNGYYDLTIEAVGFFKNAGFKLANRISVPQSSEVYSAWDIELAKQNRAMLPLARDLTIFQK